MAHVTATPSSATASSTWSTQTPSLSYDGNPATYWQASAGVGSSWIYYDLGSAKTITHVSIQTNDVAGHGPFRVQGSNDASAWTDLATVASPRHGIDVITLTTTGSYRYYRLLGTSGAGWWKINEVVFYETYDPSYPVMFVDRVYNGSAHENAYDGDDATFAQTAAALLGISVDLGADTECGSVQIKQTQVEAFKIQVGSSLLGPWTDLRTVASSAGDEGVLTTYTFTATTSRYWRIQPTAGPDWPTYSTVAFFAPTGAGAAPGTRLYTSRVDRVVPRNARQPRVQ